MNDDMSLSKVPAYDVKRGEEKFISSNTGAITGVQLPTVT